jgi:hypothetical protein
MVTFYPISTNDTNHGILDIEGQCPTKRIVTIHSKRNIITTLCGTNISKVEERCNDDDDDNDTDIFYETIETPTKSDYHEPRPQHPTLFINHPPRSQIIRVSQS